MSVKVKWLSEYDLMLLHDAKMKLKEIYEYNYTKSKRDKLSRRLETILKKIDELDDLEIEIRR